MEELTKFSMRYDRLFSGGSGVKGLEQRDLGEDHDKLTCLENWVKSGTYCKGPSVRLEQKVC